MSGRRSVAALPPKLASSSLKSSWCSRLSDGLSIWRTTMQYSSFSVRQESRNFFFKSSFERDSDEEKKRLLITGLASLGNALRPWPLDFSKSGPGRRGIKRFL